MSRLLGNRKHFHVQSARTLGAELQEADDNMDWEFFAPSFCLPILSPALVLEDYRIPVYINGIQLWPHYTRAKRSGVDWIVISSDNSQLFHSYFFSVVEHEVYTSSRIQLI